MPWHDRHVTTTQTSSPFAANLRSARLAAGLSCAAVARAAGLDTKTVFRIEAGENLPRLYTADALARAVGSTLDELLER